MDARYTVNLTSRDSATVEDVPLSPPDEDALTRRILRPLLVNNVHEKKASVRVCLVHQKRHKKNEPWEDASSFSLTTLKAGQSVKLDLDATQTWRLKEALDQLYAISESGVPHSSGDFVVAEPDSLIVTGKAKDAINSLLERHGDAAWAALEELHPDLLDTIALKRLHAKRAKAVEKFRKALDRPHTTENQWQGFFEKNTWIFGHGLCYQFLREIETQPHYGGTTLSGRGGQRGDFLLATQAQVGFTVLVDIKTPQADLVEDRQYRNKVYRPGEDLVGGVAQLQSNCRTWVIQGSQQEENQQTLDEENISTYEPKGILVIGHTSQIANDRNKRAAFELYRRNLHNPEIITFDELLARAEFIVSRGENVNGALG